MSSTSSAPPACDPLSLLHFAPNRRPHAHSSRWRAPVPHFVLRLLMRAAAASFTRTQGQGECLLHAGMTMHPPVPEYGANCNLSFHKILFIPYKEGVDRPDLSPVI